VDQILGRNIHLQIPTAMLTARIIRTECILSGRGERVHVEQRSLMACVGLFPGCDNDHCLGVIAGS